MSDSRAFTKTINPIGSGNDEQGSIHQVSPAWVLTFVSWANRDTLRTTGTSAASVRDPLVVENDCINVTTTTKKGMLTPSMTATLVMTDINYETAIAPGDFVIVNMLNWDEDARRVANAARAKTAINGLNDGFKGIFKVQGVRRVLTTDPMTGTKHLEFRVDGFAFTEFNNTIYFNPYLIDPSQDPKNQLLFASFVGNDWKNLINKKGLVDVQNIISVLIQSLVGNGISAEGRFEKNGTVKSPNIHFYMPSLIGSLLNIPGVTAAKDIYNYIFGIQQYSGSSNASLSIGMNPLNLTSPYGRFFYTPQACQGNSLLKPEYWNQVKTWSILNQYTNAPLNELYTCFRVSPNGNHVMPTMVFRQIPFTNEDFANTLKVSGASVSSSNIPVTRFLTIPRWKIDPSLIIEQDVGREEAARINFVQFFGRSSLGAEGADIAAEIAQGNILYDINDVQRSGLRPYIVTTQFDDPTNVNKDYRSPIWAKILGDSLIGGHLKLNGSILTAGLVDPISVGDNLEFDGIVYHIEQLVHSCSYDVKEGKRMFRTMISFSNGISTSSSSNGTRYGEMSYTQASDLRKRDNNNNQIIPGVSESQDVVYRTANPETNDTPAKSQPFVQPNTQQKSQNDNGSDK